jgi:hypothetical protein
VTEPAAQQPIAGGLPRAFDPVEPIAARPAGPADQADRSAQPADPAERSEQKAFAPTSEAEMSRILDFYGVEWHYEPTTFPILWNLDGEVVESFSPDFYLPEFDLYLEMTTLKQSLVRKKNRKLRRLRELYPDIRIKLFYARDFRAMMLKYGRFALAQSLSGTSGQLVGGELAGDLAGGELGSDERDAPGEAGVGDAVAAGAQSGEPAAAALSTTGPAAARRRAARAARAAARGRRAIAGHGPADPS